MERLKAQLDILSKKHSFEILDKISQEPKYISQISREMKLPFTTILQRINELEKAGFIKIIEQVDEASKRPVKKVLIINFKIDLSPSVIHQLMADDKEFKVI